MTHRCASIADGTRALVDAYDYGMDNLRRARGAWWGSLGFMLLAVGVAFVALVAVVFYFLKAIGYPGH
jgi:hypothetical protein